LDSLVVEIVAPAKGKLVLVGSLFFAPLSADDPFAVDNPWVGKRLDQRGNGSSLVSLRVTEEVNSEVFIE